MNLNKSWLYLLPVLLMHFAFTGYQIWAGHFFVPEDSYEYVRAAETIRDGEDFCIGGAECKFCDQSTRSKNCTPSDYSFRTPGYPLFLIPGLTAGNVEIITIIFQNTLAFFCFRTLFLFLQKRKIKSTSQEKGWKKIMHSEWFMVALLILCPAHFIYSNFILTETLLECLLLLFVLETIKYEEEKSTKRLLFASLLFAAALLVKPVMSVLLVPVLIYFLYKKEIRTRITTVMICLIPLLVLLTWSYRNYCKTGRYEYSSISTHNLLSYHVYLTALNSGDNADTVVSNIYKIAKSKQDYHAQQQTMSSLSRNYLWDHKMQWIGIFGKGIAIMAFDPGRFEIDFFLNGSTAVGGRYMEMFHRKGATTVAKDLWNRYGFFLAVFFITPLVNLYLLISFIGFLRNKEIPIQTRILIFIIVAGIFAASGPLGASRFRVPLTLVVMFAAFSYSRQWPVVSGRSR